MKNPRFREAQSRHPSLIKFSSPCSFGVKTADFGPFLVTLMRIRFPECQTYHDTLCPPAWSGCTPSIHLLGVDARVIHLELLKSQELGGEKFQTSLKRSRFLQKESERLLKQLSYFEKRVISLAYVAFYGLFCCPSVVRAGILGSSPKRGVQAFIPQSRE